MDEKRIQTLIREGRQFLHCQSLADQDDFVSDQQLKKPQPPLVKVAMSEQRIMLPRNFEDLDIDGILLRFYQDGIVLVFLPSSRLVYFSYRIYYGQVKG